MRERLPAASSPRASGSTSSPYCGHSLILCEERRTLQTRLRTVAERISLAGLSCFLSQWPWSEEALATAWQARFRAQLAPGVRGAHAQRRAQRPKRRGRPKATLVTGYLILDDSTRAKPKGRKMQMTWPSQQGGRTIYAHLRPSWVRKLGPCQVLITRLDDDSCCMFSPDSNAHSRWGLVGMELENSGGRPDRCGATAQSGESGMRGLFSRK